MAKARIKLSNRKPKKQNFFGVEYKNKKKNNKKAD